MVMGVRTPPPHSLSAKIRFLSLVKSLSQPGERRHPSTHPVDATIVYTCTNCRTILVSRGK
jgi:hypothetical protein